MNSTIDRSTLEIVIRAANEDVREALYDVFSGGAEADEGTTGQWGCSVQKLPVFGSMDLPFALGVLLSVPIGISTSLLASWIRDRLTTVKRQDRATPIKMEMEGCTVMLHAGEDVSLEPIVNAIAIAIVAAAAQSTPNRRADQNG